MNRRAFFFKAYAFLSRKGICSIPSSAEEKQVQ
jgi:hypothetical protein